MTDGYWFDMQNLGDQCLCLNQVDIEPTRFTSPLQAAISGDLSACRSFLQPKSTSEASTTGNKGLANKDAQVGRIFKKFECIYMSRILGVMLVVVDCQSKVRVGVT